MRLAVQPGKLLRICRDVRVQSGGVRALHATTKFAVSSTANKTAFGQSKRAFSTSIRNYAVGQEAPSARAYVDSGVLSGANNPVNVKKVLVIGSGGLSIGQAGEFDYSGKLRAELSWRHLHSGFAMTDNGHQDPRH
jgi:carbamoyl-phosphate synthase large subunit